MKKILFLAMLITASLCANDTHKTSANQQRPLKNIVLPSLKAAVYTTGGIAGLMCTSMITRECISKFNSGQEEETWQNIAGWSVVSALLLHSSIICFKEAINSIKSVKNKLKETI